MAHCILTGPVRTGKTTICQRLVAIARANGFDVRGILALPVLDDGVRTGVRMLDLASGECRDLAAVGNDALPGPRIGDYSFDASVLAWGRDLVAAALDSPCDLVVVDEIGPLELQRGQGLAGVLPRLLAPQPMPRLLVVVRSAWVAEFSRRAAPSYCTWVADEQNRDGLPDDLARFLFSHRRLA